ncbi:MAG: hypothetical protein ACO1PB_07200 [Ramlibacter sp.]
MTMRRKLLWLSFVLMLLLAGLATYGCSRKEEPPLAASDIQRTGQGTGLRSLQGDALLQVLHERIATSTGDQKAVGNAILQNFIETRKIASNWSGLYWGFAWVSAALSALAGVILKIESFANEKAKKDVAALFAVTAAILITVSTGGEFQRKWQANRIASAEIEYLGYEFVSGVSDPKGHFSKLREILLRRHQSIVGDTEPNKGKAVEGK